MGKPLNLLAKSNDTFLVCSESQWKGCHIMLPDNFVGKNDNLLHPKQAMLTSSFILKIIT